MYLTSHHVLAPGGRQEGVNAFLYSHGAVTWQVPPAEIPDQDPGTLVAESISLRPPGNRVRSYLDIVAPDEARWDEVRVALMEFVGDSQRSPLPWVGGTGRCSFRFGAEQSLARQWQKELAILYRSAQALRLAHPG
ncbi:MAG TPA: hypothetical protein VJN18_07975 [Polyangiaceae bacterium]|nr:hypothetical protein [Polyangiaceae bacterium]